MRSDKEVAREALQRAAIIHQKRTTKKRRLYAVYCTAACLLLITGLSFALPTMSRESVTPEGIYSASLLVGGAAGGYVIVGITGFVLGVAVTLHCLRKAGKD